MEPEFANLETKVEASTLSSEQIAEVIRSLLISEHSGTYLSYRYGLTPDKILQLMLTDIFQLKPVFSVSTFKPTYFLWSLTDSARKYIT